MKSLSLPRKANGTIAALVVAALGTFVSGVGSVHAATYGTNITIWDGVGVGSKLNPSEDNEAEPGMVQSQAWDLEAFFLKGNALSLVGGYNFYKGKDSMYMGDIFIDTDGDAVYSPNFIGGGPYSSRQSVSNSLFKFDYVLDVAWTNTGDVKYNIIGLSSTSTLSLGYYGSQYNLPSNPWRYVYNSNDRQIATGLLVTDYGKASQDDTGMSGWAGTDGASEHYVATFDLSSIDLSRGAVFHTTMECGNDNLLGKVPDGAHTLFLLSGVLAALAAVRRRVAL